MKRRNKGLLVWLIWPLLAACTTSIFYMWDMVKYIDNIVEPLNTQQIGAWTMAGTVAGAAAQILLTVGLPLTLFCYLVADMQARKAFRRTETNSFYAQLDTFYENICRMRLEYTHVSEPGSRKSRKEFLEYDAFALIVWNFLESIHDYCLDDEHLKETWYPVLVAESATHGKWFNEQNQRRFKKTFIDYIKCEKLAGI